MIETGNPWYSTWIPHLIEAIRKLFWVSNGYTKYITEKDIFVGKEKPIGISLKTNPRIIPVNGGNMLLDRGQFPFKMKLTFRIFGHKLYVWATVNKAAYSKLNL
jgi:hypothetical protein